MKPFIITTIFFTTAIIATAQIYFGATAGISISNIKTTVNSLDDNFKSDIGFIVAGDVNVPVGKHLLLQAGLQYESYRTKIFVTNTDSNYREAVSGKTHVEYLNVPVRLLYRLQSANNLFLVGGGPYIAIGVSGHSRSAIYSETDYGAGVIFKDIRVAEAAVLFGLKPGQLKQLNFGFGLLASYLSQNSICFSVYANIGLANLNNWQYTVTKVTAVGLTAGYVFGNKKNKGKK